MGWVASQCRPVERPSQLPTPGPCSRSRSTGREEATSARGPTNQLHRAEGQHRGTRILDQRPISTRSRRGPVYKGSALRARDERQPDPLFIVREPVRDAQVHQCRERSGKRHRSRHQEHRRIRLLKPEHRSHDEAGDAYDVQHSKNATGATRNRRLNQCLRAHSLVSLARSGIPSLGTSPPFLTYTTLNKKGSFALE
jgi:hypothetical protein